MHTWCTLRIGGLRTITENANYLKSQILTSTSLYSLNETGTSERETASSEWLASESKSIPIKC